MVEDALAAEGVKYNRSIYTPFVTLCTFLSQVLDPDHSCRAAVARVDRLVGHPRPQALLGADRHLLRCAAAAPPGGRRSTWSAEPVGRSKAGAADEWLWKRRRVLLVNGTTASMPDTPRNQAVFPQPNSQAKGLRVPAGPHGGDHRAGHWGRPRPGDGPVRGEGDRRDGAAPPALGAARGRRDPAGRLRLRLVFRHPRPDQARRRRPVPDAPGAEVRLPPGSATGDRRSCCRLDQAGAARVDGQGDL